MKDDLRDRAPAGSRAMSEHEFPPELVERFRGWGRNEIEAFIRFILRKSGHAELVASLKEMLSEAGWHNFTDDELLWEAEQGNGMAPVLLRARAALRKAGAQ